ncbi:hypothetical protein ACEU6E_03840 [Halorutilales archaeon Cl-col2-1]
MKKRMKVSSAISVGRKTVISTEYRSCGRALSLENGSAKEEKQDVLERLKQLDDEGVLDKLEDLGEVQSSDAR